jgi:AMMECR1 domain-containing protein
MTECPNKLFYTNQGEGEMWAVLGRDGQLMSEQETLLYPEVMMMKLTDVSDMLTAVIIRAISPEDCHLQRYI